MKRSEANTKVSSRYMLETVSRACAVLRQFSFERPALTLTELTQETGLERTICFRLLHTLEAEGLLRRAGGHKYASNVRILSGKRFRVGYASEANDSFCSALGQGLRWAAHESDIDLVEMENAYSAKAAIRNAEALVKQKVDLAIEFQVFTNIAPQISEVFQRAEIPLIALEIPHPGATFFGVDNYRVGALAGKCLLKAAQQRWQGECDEVLLLDLGIAGSLPNLRLKGAESVLLKGLVGRQQIFHLESRGQFVRAFEVTRRHLQFAPKRRTLLTGVNDFAVLGALRAFEESGRRELCIAVSLGGTTEARQELRLPNSNLVGAIGFFPERYGAGLMRLALDLLEKKNVPPAIHVPIQLITQQNIDQLYPQDLFGAVELHDRDLRYTGSR